MQSGDFTQLAIPYNKCRPAYSQDVINKILTLINKPSSEIHFVDVGAGTGIWTRQMANTLQCATTAVEPNHAMHQQGKITQTDLKINWVSGSAEKTNLNAEQADILSMASSFHWADFDLTMKEFHRVLKPGGWFIATWNPRIISHPLFEQFEQKIYQLSPGIKRKSSGKSEFVESLSKRLKQVPGFSHFHYIEGKHTETFDRERYIGVWESVNDIRAQMGESKFNEFMRYVKEHFPKTAQYPCEYLTRAWMVQKTW